MFVGTVIVSDGFPQLAKTNPAQRIREAFIVEYMKDQHAGNAYMRARAKAGVEVSKELAAREGSRTANIPAVRDEINRRLGTGLRLAEVTADRIKLELARIAFADPRKLFQRVEVRDLNGNVHAVDVPVDITQLDEDTARSIESIESKPMSKTIKQGNKQAALMALAKISGMIVDQKSVQAKVSVSRDDQFEGDELDYIDGELASAALELTEGMDDENSE
jgi:phage terminase small subunit